MNLPFRRKSTGESDFLARGANPSSTINHVSPSASIKDKSTWYFNPVADFKESDSSRGLSTTESAKLKRQKQKVRRRGWKYAISAQRGA